MFPRRISCGSTPGRGRAVPRGSPPAPLRALPSVRGSAASGLLWRSGMEPWAPGPGYRRAPSSNRLRRTSPSRCAGRIPVLGKRCERARRARIGSGAGTSLLDRVRRLCPPAGRCIVRRSRATACSRSGGTHSWCVRRSAGVDCSRVSLRPPPAAEARDRRDLTVRLRDRSAHPAPGGCDPGIRARGAAVEGQDTVCKARSQHPFEPRRQTVPADTTFVSSTTIAAFSIELRRLAHRFTRRQFEFCSAEGSKALANETCQVLGFGQRLTLERGAPARRVATRSNSPRSTNGW